MKVNTSLKEERRGEELVGKSKGKKGGRKKERTLKLLKGFWGFDDPGSGGEELSMIPEEL